MALILPILGCSKVPNETWQAEVDIPAYAAVNDDLDAPAFVIKKGEICTPGKTAYGKVDAYTEITCASGKGWITDDRGFKKSPAHTEGK